MENEKTGPAQQKQGTITVMLMCTIPATALYFTLPLGHELKKHGFNVVFCCADGPEVNLIRSAGFPVKTLSIHRSPFSPGNLIAIFDLFLFLKKNRVRVIETTTPVASLVGRLSALLAGVPVRINTVRGMFPRETHRLQSLIFNLTEKVLHRISSRTITINEGDRAEFIESGFAEESKIINIGCGSMGVDLERFNMSGFDKPWTRKTRKSFQICEDDFVVTFIGRLTAEKGIFDLIEIYEQLMQENEDIRGLIVGDVLEGEHAAVTRKDLEEILFNKNISDKVRLTGFRKDVPELIAISDVVVLPSKREGFGNTLAEAAAMAKPVVAYRCRGSEQAIINEKTGFIIEQGDINGFKSAIQLLHDNRKIADTIGARAAEEAQKRFNREIVVGKYVDVFQSAIKDAGARVYFKSEK